MIPEFRHDGYLPEGIHIATEAEVTFRFGAATARRRRLVLRLRHWLELSRLTHARRFLVGGSFVTTKPEPKDVDAVVLLAAEDTCDWNEWVEFLSRTRESDGRRKGLVEVTL
jgi:hypothetical protein